MIEREGLWEADVSEQRGKQEEKQTPPSPKTKGDAQETASN